MWRLGSWGGHKQSQTATFYTTWESLSGEKPTETMTRISEIDFISSFAPYFWTLTQWGQRAVHYPTDNRGTTSPSAEPDLN